MPKGPLPQELHEMLARPNPAVIATIGAQGRLVSVATWYLFEGGRFLVNMDAGRKRVEHLRRDPRVSLTVLDGDSWYNHVSVQGTIEGLVEDAGLVDIDRLARHYSGQQYRNRDRPRVSAWFAAETWHGWGAAGHYAR